MDIKIEHLPTPELLDEFYGTTTYLHSRVLLNGDWCLTIKQYVTVEQVTRPTISSLDDEVADEPEVQNSEPVTKYGVQSNWEMAKYNYGTDFPTLEAAHDAARLACQAIVQFFHAKMPIIWPEMPTYKYTFRYGEAQQATVTVKASNQPEAYRKAIREMDTRYANTGKEPPAMWSLTLIKTTDPYVPNL